MGTIYIKSRADCIYSKNFYQFLSNTKANLYLLYRMIVFLQGGKMADQAMEFLNVYKSKRSTFTVPSEADKTGISNLLKLIKQYDEVGLSTLDRVKLLKPDPDAIYKAKIISEIEAQLEALDMSMTSFSQPEYQNVVCFHPKQPRTGQIGFFWRFGKVGIKDNATPDPLDVGPFVISDLHRGIDGASGIALKEFNTLKAKVYLFNTIHPHSSDLPSKSQPNRKITDGAHSRDTLANPFLRTLLLELYPDFAINVVHGLAAINRKTGEVRFMELWVINGVRRAFDLSNKNWGALLTIALAQQDFAFGTISVSGRFTGKYIVDNQDIKRNLVSGDKYDGVSVFDFLRGPNTDEQVHVVNINENRKFQDSGRAIHMEHGVPYRDNTLENDANLKKQKHLLDAFTQAGRWFQLWDNRVHKFAEMPDNVREFPEWFDNQLLKLKAQNEATSTIETSMIFSTPKNSLSQDNNTAKRYFRTK